MKKITIPGLFNASLASYVVADCPMTDAIYSYANNPLVTARFQPLKHKSLTDVYFSIASSTGQNQR